jgi:hypothetical protein
MKSNHYLTLGLLLGALALIVSGLHDWSEAVKPQVIGGAMLSIASVLKGIHEESPTPERR